MDARNSDYNERIRNFAQLLNESRGIVFFGGAGISTESGIPDFRSPEGLYNKTDKKYGKYSPEYLLDRDCLYNNSKIFYEFYRDKMDIRRYRPNRAHIVLAQFEKLYPESFLGIITQNIDGLHKKAGNTKVAEIHGTMSRCYCECNEYPEDYIFTSDEAIPKCPHCRALIRPSVTLYGETLPMDEYGRGKEWLGKADLLIVGGTSLQVEPAASMVTRYFGKSIVVINQEDIMLVNGATLNENADISFHANVRQVLEDVFHELTGKYIIQYS